ncbi:cold shock domain-containing protein [Pedobacter panaciterrae]|nr:cold shock domain-containing protein [Pedobacter panaciterrae]
MLNTPCQKEQYFFNELKGFGFIVPNNGDPELFVHASASSAPSL